MRKNTKGFTLFELIIAMALLTILSTMSYMSFVSYTLKQHSSRAQQEMIKLSVQLEQYKSSNFTYSGFSTSSVSLPKDAADNGSQKKIKYNLSIVDTSNGNPLSSSSAKGSQWAIKAVSTDDANFTYLLNSDGVQCKNKVKDRVTYKTCGAALQGSEGW
jgi:type IV pilus assembly protein PilE